MLTPDKIRYELGVKINEKIIPWGALWSKSWGSFKKGDRYKADRNLTSISYVTIHNTNDLVNCGTVHQSHMAKPKHE
ncbi:hypothetical protein FACS1894198_3910 [Clostridia bacterium]|nr:hypothetical protein FACS1894198_3910 [Clostridia bacterium]